MSNTNDYYNQLLLKRPTGSRPDCLEDLFGLVACSIEDSIQQFSNAQPGKDYTVIDLYKLAQPIVTQMFKDNKDISFATTWPRFDEEDKGELE
jgi:hypothetical protein